MSSFLKLILDFGQWSAWTECSVTCGGSQQTRSRSCENGSQGQVGCIGDIEQTQNCNIQDCPCKIFKKILNFLMKWTNNFLDFTEWSAWDECSVTCGGSEISRTRSCKNGVQGDIGCIGDVQESDFCNVQDCPCKWITDFGFFENFLLHQIFYHL